MTLVLLAAVLVASLWLPDLLERLAEERSMPGFEDGTKSWKRWSDSLRMREGR